ncbi:hypothetical protein J2Z17_000848 [Rhizobium halophytocola]|uniref:Uncharacterized protein n=1 Tax=Rhizobium halophytocola TaxID=735519 RepID=A0ABS4DUS1_9HYPH|nr:hypothetical protein [Rhizobium halophytocola]MBP1849427.1 hypothetical protein [Rhizobium halophytocola]
MRRIDAHAVLVALLEGVSLANTAGQMCGEGEEIALAIAEPVARPIGAAFKRGPIPDEMGFVGFPHSLDVDLNDVFQVEPERLAGGIHLPR